MANKPIIFSGAMVRALLAGTKTQTRRVLKPQPHSDCAGFQKVFNEPPYFEALDRSRTPLYAFPAPDGCVSPYPNIRYAVGDLLYVREGWRPLDGYSSWDCRVIYKSDGAEIHFADGECDPEGTWVWPKAADRGFVPSIHMPRWASRLTLEVTDVRVQRLQDISEEDARAEGVRGNAGGEWGCEGLIEDFAGLWDSLHGEGAWDRNDWVAAYTFTVHQANVDDLIRQREAA